jgi:hypothetical protein
MGMQEVVSSELVNSQFFVVDCRKGATVSKFVVIFANPLCCRLKASDKECVYLLFKSARRTCKL